MSPKVPTGISLAKGHTLPLEAVTETFAILGRRGSGKTHSASVLAEEMLGAGLQVVIIDPLDVWSGLRSSADGKREGYPVVVFGGAQGDLPLEGNSGRLLADAVIDRGVSAVVSLRHLSKTEQRRFVGEFCERLYERKGEEAHKRPLHLIIDEADAFIPQRIQPGGERAYGAIDTIVRRGRSSGFGTTLISQRAAVIAKDVLTQTEVLVCHQTTGPQDRKALEAWIEQNDDEGHRAKFLASLASLKKGEAWFWSPAWLRVFTRVQVRPRRTFDSSSTPRIGEARVTPQKLAAVDIEALRAELAGAVEKAEADDPKVLRKRIAELERHASGLEKRFADLSKAPRPEVRKVTLEPDLARMLQEGLERFRRANEQAIEQLRNVVQKVLADRTTSPTPAPASSTATPSRPKQAARAHDRVDDSGGGSLPKGEAAILTAILQHPQGCTREQLTVLTGYKRSSRDTYLQRLKAGALVEQQGSRIVGTAAGRRALPDFEPLPTGKALLRHWLERLPQGEATVLQAIADRHPRTVSRDEISAATGYRRSSRDTYLQRLRARELIRVSSEGIQLSEVLR